MADALSDLKIVDFSRVLAGPFATMVLGDLGAEVTKIERPGEGDETRSWGPPFDDSGEATYFLAVNRNKRSVAIDLADPVGLERALRLIDRADVVVENFRPGVMERLGLGYDVLRERNRGLVYCAITGFGSGEGAALPGYDLLVQALGGLMSITGSAEGEPTKVGVALVDVLAGLFAGVGILAALRHRERTGVGQRVEVSLLSSLLAALSNQAAGFTAAGVVPGRLGNAHPSIAPYELFRTAEGDLVVACGNDRQFEAMCEVLDAPALAADPRFRSNPDRVRNRGSLRAELERLLLSRPAADWVRELTVASVPAGAVNDVGAAFELATELGLEPIVSVPRPESGETRLPRNPISLSETPPSYRLPPPPLDAADG